MRIVVGGPLSTYVKARTADAIGDQGRAAELFAALAGTDPKDFTLGRRAVTAAINAGAFDLALSSARRLPEQELALDGRLLLIADALRRGRPSEAIALGATPDSDAAFLVPLLSAWNDSAAGRDGERQLTGSAATESLLAPFLAEQRAFLLVAHGRTAEAAPLIQEALSRAGGRETRLRLAFADGLRKAGDQAGAEALLSDEEPAFRASAQHPAAPGIAIDSAAAAYAELMLGIAVTLSQSQERSLPIALVQSARLAAPQSSEAAIVLALLLDRDKRPEDALAVLRGVSPSDPFVGDARDTQARLLWTMGRKTEAVAFAREAVTTAGQAATAEDWARLGNALDEAGQHSESADAFARAAALADAAGASNRWTFRLLRADQLEEIDRWPEAKAELRAALAVSPEQPLVLNFLGYGSLEHGEDLVAAEAMIRKASGLVPDDASITDSLGWALFKTGRTAEAIETLRKAAAGDPAQAEIHEHLGDALYTAGRRIEARFSWNAALVTAEGKEKQRIEAKLETGLTPATAAP